MSDLFKVQTTDGVLSWKGKDGATEKVAQGVAAEKNKAAEKLGIETRYEAVPLHA